MKEVNIKLYKQVRVGDCWQLCKAVFDRRGKVRKDYVVVAGNEELHPEGTYHLEWSQDGQRRREAAGQDAFMAADKVHIKKAQLMAHRVGLLELPMRQGETPLDNAIEDFLALKRNLRPNTLESYRGCLAQFRKTTNARYVEQLTRNSFLTFSEAQQKRGLSPRSIASWMVIVSIFMKCTLGKHPIEKGDIPKFVKTVRSIYEESEIEALFAVADPDELMAFKIYLFAGLRDREGKFLTWRDIDSSNNVLRVTSKTHWGFAPKNYEEREIPIPQGFMEALSKYKPEGAKLDDQVFQWTKLSERLKKCAERAKLNCGHCVTRFGNRCATGPHCKRFFLHKFRHTFATRHLQDGIDIRTLQQWMGHNDLASTMIYLKAVRSKDVQARVNNGSMAKFA